LQHGKARFFGLEKVNFYKRFIGDIQAKTGGLTLAEFGAYDRLLDHYYATEAPLPDDISECYRIARAMSKEERKAVERVIGRFFLLTPAGYVQTKAEEVIADALPKIEAARANGAKGGRPKKTQEEPTGLSGKEPTGLNIETQHEPNTKASQSQISSSLRSEDSAGKPRTTRRRKTDCRLADYIELCKTEGKKPVPPEHPIREYAKDAGITDEMLQISWLMFKDDFTTGNSKEKTQKDWPAHFANSIRRRWYGLWVTNETGDAEWTSTGLQQKRVLEARLKKMEEAHAPA
jgi:uncharacterized protein YdaU (DUF1376 family)